MRQIELSAAQHLLKPLFWREIVYNYGDKVVYYDKQTNFTFSLRLSFSNFEKPVGARRID